MALDIQLFTDMNQQELGERLASALAGTPFAVYTDWQNVRPSTASDAERLRCMGLEMTVASDAWFRLRKETRDEELAFLKSFAADLSKHHTVAMLLNGERFDR